MHIYLKNNPAKFHPIHIWNVALGFYWRDGPNKNKNNNNNNNKMNSDMWIGFTSGRKLPVAYVQQLSASTEQFQYFASRLRFWGFQLPESSLKRLFASHILSPKSARLTSSIAAGQPLPRPLLAHFLPATQISSHHNASYTCKGQGNLHVISVYTKFPENEIFYRSF